MDRRFAVAIAVALSLPAARVRAQTSFEEATIDVGNVGITITNSGFVGRAAVRNTPTGEPSFEYPLDSGVEHLFESGLWVGAVRSDGTITVRTGAVTVSTGYTPGGTGYELAPLENILERSALLDSPFFTRRAVSHQDFTTAYTDTARVLPGTSIPMPDPAGQLGMKVIQRSYAWNFPFTEYFAILTFDLVNESGEAWDSVYVGLWHDLVVRNVNTTNDAGSAFFNKNGVGYIDSLQTTYAFNAGGMEETLNTYGAIAVLGAEWVDPATGTKRFVHPSTARDLIRDGYSPAAVNPRWWLFGGGIDEFSRPAQDVDKYRRMSTPYPDSTEFASRTEYEQARDLWYARLRTDGLISAGNWIGLTPLGPFRTVRPGDTLSVSFALVAALKPDEFQGQQGKSIDTPESRRLLANNVRWARRTFAGEDNNYNGKLDPGEDLNGNGVLDRFLIPEPPSAPHIHLAFETATDTDTGRPESTVSLYWDRSAEASVDPVTGRRDFEGYRVYRSNPGDDRAGDILARAGLIAQYDKPGNRTGYNNGFGEIALSEPVYFPGDSTAYWYRFDAGELLSGWQYLFTVTAFDEGDVDAGLDPFESSRTANATRVFPGTPADGTGTRKVGVYPNPYRVHAAWDGSGARNRKLNFYNLPPRAEIRVYTLAGEIVARMDHRSDTYAGDTRWYDDFSAPNRILAGGEHSWDILSENALDLAGGLYFYTVKDLDDGSVQTGKFVIIK